MWTPLGLAIRRPGHILRVLGRRARRTANQRGRQLRGLAGTIGLGLRLLALWAQERARRPDAPRAGIKGRVLHIGVSYYNNWYLTQSLLPYGWEAHTLAMQGEGGEQFLHGAHFYLQEFSRAGADYAPVFPYVLRLLKAYHRRHYRRDAPPGHASAPPGRRPLLRALLRLFFATAHTRRLEELRPLEAVLEDYDILHFTGINSTRYFFFFNPAIFDSLPIGWDVELLRLLGKKIVYSNIGCSDGVTQRTFIERWGDPRPICYDCMWFKRPDVCSNEGNVQWGELRNRAMDFQVMLGGYRADANDNPLTYEVPGFFCLDSEVWKPDLDIPPQFRLDVPGGVIRLYHAVGNFDLRTAANNVNTKSTHIWLPLIDQLKAEGYPLELLFFSKVPNRDVRFYQAQADIFLDMLTFGFFGANTREAMMLGKPVICFVRPEWLATVARELPDYAAELPVVSATPETARAALIDLIEHPEKRAELGRRGRAFALKWHSKEAGARQMDQVYSKLLCNEPFTPGQRAFEYER